MFLLSFGGEDGVDGVVFGGGGAGGVGFNVDNFGVVVGGGDDLKVIVISSSGGRGNKIMLLTIGASMQGGYFISHFDTLFII